MFFGNVIIFAARKFVLNLVQGGQVKDPAEHLFWCRTKRFWREISGKCYSIHYHHIRKAIKGKTKQKKKWRTSCQLLSFISKTDCIFSKQNLTGLCSLSVNVFLSGASSPNMVRDCLRKLINRINIPRQRAGKSPSSGTNCLIRRQIVWRN